MDGPVVLGRQRSEDKPAQSPITQKGFVITNKMFRCKNFQNQLNTCTFIDDNMAWNQPFDFCQLFSIDCYMIHHNFYNRMRLAFCSMSEFNFTMYFIFSKFIMYLAKAYSDEILSVLDVKFIRIFDIILYHKLKAILSLI